MGFTDMMSSGRGPGVIGMLIALLVLGGFGTLTMVVFDESMSKGGATLEGTIHRNADEIATTKSQIEQSQRELDAAEARVAVSRQADKLKAEAAASVAGLASAQERREEAVAAVAAVDKTWEDYKNTYRTSERKAAVGQELPEIKTLNGTTYKSVVIKSVDEVGMQIVHEEGHSRIPYKMLPVEMQDRFQFDASQEVQKKQTEQSFAQNNAATARYSQAFEALQAKREKLAEMNRALDADRRYVANVQQVTPKKEQELVNYRASIAAERTKSVSRAPIMEQQLKTMESDWHAMQKNAADKSRGLSNGDRDVQAQEAEIAKAETDLAKLKKEAQAATVPDTAKH